MHQLGIAVNWSRIIWLALSLFAAQFLIGFLEGVMSAPDTGISWLLAGHTVSLAAGMAIFASFAMHTPNRPFVHAWLGLLLQVLIAALFSAGLALWLDSIRLLSVVMEWAVLVAALVVGTSLGIGLRRCSDRRADA
ncbi:hypothetical protein [Xanthomonas bonasiae]|uniref:hypothetical protein n=1 Tax=Xanthomonas bonasiae TaxID=2810351 RepID=UPI00177B4EF2|nr:hypothetical protein [Xanthomonas surreyensis]MBD7923496.1 hypothetical protein [Xanthomonas surreyensis]